jgi:hypothetical protein
MKEPVPVKPKSTPRRLICPACGNADRFIEVMAEEAHIVDGNLRYLHLLEAWVDHYVCPDCGKTLPIPAWARPK